MRPLPTRIVILEQRILPPPAPVDYRAEDEAVGLLEMLRERLAGIENRVLERRLARWKSTQTQL